jgi:hypothetical protein
MHPRELGTQIWLVTPATRRRVSVWLGILASTSRRGRCRPESQHSLFVPLAIGRLCTQVVSLDGANGEVSIDGQIEPSPSQDGSRANRSEQRTAGAGEQPVEGVNGAS